MEKITTRISEGFNRIDHKRMEAYLDPGANLAYQTEFLEKALSRYSCSGLLRTYSVYDDGELIAVLPIIFNPELMAHTFALSDVIFPFSPMSLVPLDSISYVLPKPFLCEYLHCDSVNKAPDSRFPYIHLDLFGFKGYLASLSKEGSRRVDELSNKFETHILSPSCDKKDFTGLNERYLNRLSSRRYKASDIRLNLDFFMEFGDKYCLYDKSGELLGYSVNYNVCNDVHTFGLSVSDDVRAREYLLLHTILEAMSKGISYVYVKESIADMFINCGKRSKVIKE